MQSQAISAPTVYRNSTRCPMINTAPSMATDDAVSIAGMKNSCHVTNQGSPRTTPGCQPFFVEVVSDHGMYQRNGAVGMARNQRQYIAGAVASTVGIIIAASGGATPGGLLVVSGWLVFLYGIHRFGREGAA